MVTDVQFQKYSEGIFKPYFEKFIEFKRSKGEKVAPSALNRMKWLNDQLNQTDSLNVTKETAEFLLTPAEGVSEITRYARISFLRQFLNFMNTLGIECYRIPMRYTKSIHCEFRPYIFSDEEICKLYHAADSLHDWHHSMRRNDIYPIIVRLLSCTGMRIGELVTLKPDDIDIESGIIKVLNGKNGVSRYIPMSDSLRVYIEPYCKKHEDDEWLFQSPINDSHYDPGTIRHMFKKMCMEAHIYRSNGNVPNIHSLRHTFCTRSLNQLLSSGMDVYTAVPILAAYVGHVNYRDTESYIHFTENDFDKFQESQSALRNIIPEVNINE